MKSSLLLPALGLFLALPATAAPLECKLVQFDLNSSSSQVVTVDVPKIIDPAAPGVQKISFTADCAVGPVIGEITTDPSSGPGNVTLTMTINVAAKESDPFVGAHSVTEIGNSVFHELEYQTASGTGYEMFCVQKM